MIAARAFGLGCCLAIVTAESAEPPPLQGGDEVSPRFATTPFLEPDRCATAWVIKRYVHPDATFSFHAREQLPEDAEPFDLPEAELKRDARRSTVEVLVEREQLTDPFVLRLARLVHDIEINAWALRRETGSRELEHLLGEAFTRYESPAERLAVCFEILDRLRLANGRVEALVDRGHVSD